jgi:hypothetical protein
MGTSPRRRSVRLGVRLTEFAKTGGSGLKALSTNVRQLQTVVVEIAPRNNVSHTPVESSSRETGYTLGALIRNDRSLKFRTKAARQRSRLPCQQLFFRLRSEPEFERVCGGR